MSNIPLSPCELILHTREQLIARLRGLYDKGYRYIVRDAPGVLPAYPINSVDCPEISWSHRVAMEIKRFLGD